MPGQDAKVLICCDPGAGLELVIPQLRNRSYNVVHAPSIYRAVSMHSADPADAVIIDANSFADKDYEVFDIFREARAAVKLFASISMSRRDKTPLLLRCGVDGYFLEPFYADEIINALERALKPTESAAGSDRTDKLAALGRFARGVAHEVNNPLATLSGWVQILVSEAEQDDPRATTFEVMQQELDRIAKVVQDLLAFSGQPSPQREQVDINALIRNLARGNETDGIEFNTKLDRSLPKVYANNDQLREAIGRVIDFTQAHANGSNTIDIETRNEKAQAVVILRGSIGRLNDDLINGMFDPFYSNNGDASEGGLGLALSYGIIKGLGGTAEARSEADGIVFTLAVPAANEAK